MRIAIFTETFLPKIDGIVNTFCYFLDYLAAQGHDSLLFAPEGSLAHYANTPVIRYPGVTFPWYPELKLAWPTWSIGRHLAGFRPDVVHVANPVSLGMAGIFQARRQGIPVAASFHTDVAGFAAQWGFKALDRPIWAWLRSVHNLADLNFCPSYVTLRQLQAHRFQRVKVWSHGVDTARFHPGKRTAVWRERLSDGHPEAPLLLFVGRVSPEKGIDQLRPVLEQFPQTRLAVVGDGPARANLKAHFAGLPVVFTGYLRGEELAYAYAAADIFTFPSPHETLGNVVLEAMASGLPVIAPRSGGLLDFLREGENGLAYAPGNEAGLITAVHHLLTNNTLRQQLAENGRRLAESLTWAHVFDGLLADYQTLIQTYSRRRRQLSVGQPEAAPWHITNP
jgi:phosphatidylinositol alpha 1,6-mannosyltransferase